jgi:hypothetical protein
MWYRWDWALEVSANVGSPYLKMINDDQYKEFQVNHKGGKHYDVSKMTKAEKEFHNTVPQW